METITRNYADFQRTTQTRTPKEGMETPGYTIRMIKEKDFQQVLHFLDRLFFKDEPLNVAVGLLDEPGSTCVELESYCIESMAQGVSLMAVSGSNQILGVCLNGVSSREEGEEGGKKADDLEECDNKKFRKILNLLSTVSRESDIFGQFPEVERALEIRIVSVDEACRGQGIAKALLDRCRNLAKECGFPLVRVDCTSHYSALAVARLGFHCVYTLNYSDHLDDEGKPVFTPEPPHSCVKTFVMPVS